MSALVRITDSSQASRHVRNASFHCRGGLRGVASVPAQAVAHRSRRRAPPELHHQIGGHHADDFSLAAASRRKCDAGRLVCTVRRWRRPDRQHRHRRRYRAAARRRCRRLSWAGVTRVMLRLAQIRTEVPQAEMQAASPAAAFADTDSPLWEGLGGVTYRITTANELAQSYFNQGLRLTYAFNHSEAQRAFRKAQKLDPDCAMCFWGEALVLGPNINLPMQEDAVAPAFAAAEKARMLAPKATPREQALIAAVSTRYAKDAKADRVPLDAAYALAMEKVAAQFPDDNEIAVLYAESVMDLSPWKYWQPGGHAPNQQSGHLVHMPSHIYYRVGRYLDALADNKTAIGVDEKYLASTNAPMGVYRLGYYPHNVHFVLASAQMAGDGPTVIAAAEKLRGLIPDEVARGIALVQPVKAAPYFAHALFSPSATVLALPDP